nr:MAG TPA: hypothetical protein [Caudoviricetes sp.]
MQIVVAGEYNSRKQFVVKKYSVIGKTKIMIEFEAMNKDLSILSFFTMPHIFCFSIIKNLYL